MYALSINQPASIRLYIVLAEDLSHFPISPKLLQRLVAEQLVSFLPDKVLNVYVNSVCVCMNGVYCFTNTSVLEVVVVCIATSRQLFVHSLTTGRTIKCTLIDNKLTIFRNYA